MKKNNEYKSAKKVSLIGMMGTMFILTVLIDILIYIAEVEESQIQCTVNDFTDKYWIYFGKNLIFFGVFYYGVKKFFFPSPVKYPNRLTFIALFSINVFAVALIGSIIFYYLMRHHIIINHDCSINAWKTIMLKVLYICLPILIFLEMILFLIRKYSPQNN